MIQRRIFASAFAICAIALFSAFTLGLQTIKIQTTAVCGMCKDRIETVLGQAEGVEEARLDLTTKKVKIKYDDTKQSEASLKAIIAKTGYGADDVTADAEAFEALPGCCKSAKACSAAKAAGEEGAMLEAKPATKATSKAGCKKACAKTCSKKAE